MTILVEVFKIFFQSLQLQYTFVRSRTRFMLETIAALRTNNARKIPNYDPSLLEHMKKLLRGIVHSSGTV